MPSYVRTGAPTPKYVPDFANTQASLRQFLLFSNFVVFFATLPVIHPQDIGVLRVAEVLLVSEGMHEVGAAYLYADYLQQTLSDPTVVS